MLVRLQPCGLCPGAQGRRTAGFGSSKLLESASICRVWSGRCLSRPGCCLSWAMRLPEGVATSPRRQQPCPPWAGAAAGPLGWGAGVAPRPPGEAAGILWSPWQPSPGAQERDAEPRLTPGGHQQNCRSGSQAWRSRCAGGAPRSAEAVHPWGVASVTGVLSCSPPRGCSGLGGFRFLSPGVMRLNTT